MRSSRRCRGFSLLELMIVLVIMVAATAVVWPNLQKPLSRTSLTESASQLRELLDEARNRASSRGSAYFVRLETGSSRIHFGTLQQFLEASSLSNDAVALAGSSQPSQVSTVVQSTSGSQPPQLRQLAGTVVVESVRNSIAPAPTSSLEVTLDSYSGEAELEPGLSGVEESSIDQPFEAGLDSRVYWLPMLATHLGRDATIKLYDNQLQDSIEITYCAATGSIEILP